MDSIADNLVRIRMTLPDGVQLVAVSKFNPVEKIKQAYDAGQRLFGESRVQELLEKVPALPNDIRWHFIGHLQTNKVRHLVGNVSLIESVDSERLLALISAESAKKGVVTDVLLQLHVAKEETKFGFSVDEMRRFMATAPWQKYAGIRIRGIMGMASNTDDIDRVEGDFKSIRGMYDMLKSLYGSDVPDFDIVSMGMSGDYMLAIQAGSNMVRIGSAIFGARMYANR